MFGAQGVHSRPASTLQAAAGEFRLLNREEQGDRVVLELDVGRLGTGHLDLPHHEPTRHDEDVHDVGGVRDVKGVHVARVSTSKDSLRRPETRPRVAALARRLAALLRGSTSMPSSFSWYQCGAHWRSACEPAGLHGQASPPLAEP